MSDPDAHAGIFTTYSTNTKSGVVTLRTSEALAENGTPSLSGIGERNLNSNYWNYALRPPASAALPAGCTIKGSSNWSVNAKVDDGSCILIGIPTTI
jgi:hypothetical protein